MANPTDNSEVQKRKMNLTKLKEWARGFKKALEASRSAQVSREHLDAVLEAIESAEDDPVPVPFQYPNSQRYLRILG